MCIIYIYANFAYYGGFDGFFLTVQFEVQLEARYWGVRVRAQVFERFLCIPSMSFDLSFNSFLLLVFELKCLRSYSEFNPQFSKDISVETDVS